MSNLDSLLTWVSSFEQVQEIKEYDDLNNEFYSLKMKVESNKKITEEEDKEFLKIIKRQWKRVIADKYTEIKNRIENRNTNGQSFSANLRELEKIRSDGEKDLPLVVYYSLYKFNLLDIEKDVDEKISIEKYLEELNKSNKDYIDKISKDSRNKGIRDGIIVSFVVGIVLLIIGIILHYLGFT